jgi:hypothetical protein
MALSYGPARARKHMAGGVGSVRGLTVMIATEEFSFGAM